jgi:hypothetical protein
MLVLQMFQRIHHTKLVDLILQPKLAVDLKKYFVPHQRGCTIIHKQELQPELLQNLF